MFVARCGSVIEAQVTAGMNSSSTILNFCWKLARGADLIPNHSTSLEHPNPSATVASRPLSGNWLVRCTLLSAAFVLWAVLPWWNRFFALTTDGWHYYYGRQILAGKVPYRDFYLFVPPLYPLKNALVIALFGDHMIYMHILAVAEIVLFAAVLIAWISSIFPLFETSIAVATAIALYIFGYKGEALSGLHQETVFFPILSAWTASLALKTRRPILVVLAGVLAALSLLAKQTSGIATLLCLGMLLPILILSRDGMRRALLALFWYALGAALPIAATFVWLGSVGGLSAFISQAFVKGSASKGSVPDILLRPIFMILHDPYFKREAFLAVTCVCVLLLVTFRSKRSDNHLLSKTHLFLFFGIAFSSIAAAAILSRWFTIQNLHPFLQVFPQNFMLFFGEFGCFALFVMEAWAVFHGRNTERNLQLLLLAGFGSGLAYMVACSWVDYPTVVLPSLAVTLSYFFSSLAATRSLRWVRAAMVTLCALVIFQFCMSRMEVPFKWGGWREPNVHSANQRLPYSQLAGFRVSPASAEFINRVTDDIIRNSKPGDRVLAYPDIPIFYVLANRSPATFAYVHYVDVAPDYIDRVDAQTILRTPPAVIVYWDMTESELREGDKNFRHGNRSGVHDFVDVLSELQPKYRTIDTFQTNTGDKFIVMAHVPD